MGLLDVTRPLQNIRPSVAARNFAKQMIAEQAKEMGGSAELLSLVPRVDEIETFIMKNNYRDMELAIGSLGFSRANRMIEVFTNETKDFANSLKTEADTIKFRFSQMRAGFELLATDSRDFATKMYGDLKGLNFVNAARRMRLYFKGGNEAGFDKFYGLAPIIEGINANFDLTEQAFGRIVDSTKDLANAIVTVPRV